MATNLYPGFLHDARQYAQAEAFWVQLWEETVRLTGQKREWRQPWLRTTFANGTPFRDGDPIFSALSAERGLAVRVIQHEPEGDEADLDLWVDDFGDEGEKVSVLVISCALSKEEASYARELLYSWMMEGSVRIVRGAEGPATVPLPPEKLRWKSLSPLQSSLALA